MRFERIQSAYGAGILPIKLKEHRAGSENRTHVTSLENWHSTIELYPLMVSLVINISCSFALRANNKSPAKNAGISSKILFFDF